MNKEKIVYVGLGVVILAVIMFLGFLFSGKMPTGIKKPEAKRPIPTVAEKLAPILKKSKRKPTPQPQPKADRDIYNDNTRWEIIEVKNLGNKLISDNRFIPSRITSGYFLYVVIKVENLGKQTKSIQPLKIEDNHGRIFLPSCDTMHWIPENKRLYYIKNLGPNLPFEFATIYELPINAKGLVLLKGQREFILVGY